jgi:nucleotide-binding universal stress UspA family protein
MYKKILVPLDGSSTAECVIPHVQIIARASKAEVELLAVVEPVEIPTRGEMAIDEDLLKQIETSTKQDIHKYLNDISTRLSHSGIKAHPIILTGKTSDTLIDYISNNDIDIVIMATHGRSGIKKWIWGSVAEKVIRAVNVPVLLVKAVSCDDK